MSTTSLTAGYALPAGTRTPVVLLIIEQRPWPGNLGLLTKGGMVRHILEALYGQEVPDIEDSGGSHVDCGMSDGKVVSEVYVYPYTSGLGYQLYLSHGTLGERLVSTVRVVEVLNFKPGSVAAATSYPVRSLESVRWLGEQHDAALNPVAPPGLAVTGVMEISSAVPVYGAASVIYETERHSYAMEIPPRADVPEHLFSCVAYAVYDGGLVWEQMEPPPGAEEYDGYEDNECGRGGETTFGPGEDPDPSVPDDAHADRVIIVDWCSQTIISDTIYAS